MIEDRSTKYRQVPLKIDKVKFLLAEYSNVLLFFEIAVVWKDLVFVPYSPLIWKYNNSKVPQQGMCIKFVKMKVFEPQL